MYFPLMQSGPDNGTWIALAVIAVVIVVALAVRARSGKTADENAASAAVPVAAAAAPAAAHTAGVTAAPGSAGEIKLYSVPEKQAAMIMAIVADHLRTPLNQLRFKSIRQVD